MSNCTQSSSVLTATSPAVLKWAIGHCFRPGHFASLGVHGFPRQCPPHLLLPHHCGHGQPVHPIFDKGLGWRTYRYMWYWYQRNTVYTLASTLYRYIQDPPADVEPRQRERQVRSRSGGMGYVLCVYMYLSRVGVGGVRGTCASRVSEHP